MDEHAQKALKLISGEAAGEHAAGSCQVSAAGASDVELLDAIPGR
jgi:hypothetical protein